MKDIGLQKTFGLLLCLLFVIYLFVVIACSVVDWSQDNTSPIGIGLWQLCLANGGQCITFETSSNPAYDDCEGSLLSARAFSVLSILFVFFTTCYLLFLIFKPLKINTGLLVGFFALNMVTHIWLLCAWVMWIGVEDRDICQYNLTNTHYGSGWFLQLFAWLFHLVVIALCIYAILIWRNPGAVAQQVGGPNAAHAAPYDGFPPAGFNPMGPPPMGFPPMGPPPAPMGPGFPPMFPSFPLEPFPRM